MSMFSSHLKTPALWLLLAATVGSISASAASPDSPRNSQAGARANYDVVVGDVYSGRSPYFRSANTQPIVLAQAKPTVVISGPGGVPAAAMAPAGNCSSVNTGLVQMSKTMPPEVTFGENFTYEIRPAAVACVGNVVVIDTVPDGATLVSTEPQASVSGNQLTWNLGNMDAGDAKVLKVTVKAEREGTLTSCAIIKADPRVCAKTVVGRPQLAIDKTGPEIAKLGDDVTYNVVVKNVGTAVAKAVTVTDKVPAGLGGPREIPFTVGDLAPGASKTIPVTLKAAERGRHCNLAIATAANAPSVQDDACTTVVKPGIKLVKTGMTEQFVGRQATYKMVASNIGDTELTGVVLTDTGPSQTKIVTASGANVAGNTATWNVGSLKAGESKEFNLTLTSMMQGTWCNSATVVAAGGLRETAEACTLWKGVAGLLVEFVDDPDPIQVGEQVVYTIRITNQGNADLTNIGTTGESDAEIDLISSPQGTIAGKKISFPSVAKLGGKQSITYTFTGKAVSIGQAYQKVAVTVDGYKAPIEELEVTSTY
jgi:uncharacterized repeat protein (TIGR01451 family)